MPTNLYGPGDNYHLENSHVIPAIIRKIHLAKCIEKSDWKAIKQDIKNNPIKGLAENSTNNQILKILAKQGIKQLKTQDSRLITDDSQLNEVEVELWGTGKPMREFLHVDDMAEACIFVMNLDKEIYQQHTKSMLSHINVGAGQDLTIKKLAECIAEIVGFKGKIEFYFLKPDGTKRKLMDSTRLNSLGWHPSVGLEEGIKLTYEGYLINNR
jgi:GDP-L-fucose synthase